ncbi:DUF3080 domain-containing protein [Methylophaga thalassica]|nr:DUF3080 domain-containing protein [Methylophaga thalassica]
MIALRFPMLSIKCVFVLALVFLLTSCDPFSQPESMMDEYLVRLARVLEQDLPAPAAPVLTKLPDKKERTLSIPEIDVNMLEFLSFYGCELQVVVAERNSILGRVMLPINRLRYEVRFIESAKQCLATTDDKKTTHILQQAIAKKSAVLPAVFWNAIWSTEEIEQLMTYSKGYLPVDANSINTIRTGLQALVDIKKQIDNKKFDINLDHLGTIQQQWLYSHVAGKLLKSAQLLTLRLNEATRIIDKRLIQKPFCYKQRVTPQAEILRSFFFNIYIAKVQPYLASVSQQGESIFPLLDKLAVLQGESEASDEFQHYQRTYLDTQSSSGIWQKLQTAIQLHTKSWQHLLKQCGMQPGVNS